MRTETIGDCAWTRIYALCEPDMRVRYVGKTTQWLHRRHKAHIQVAQNGKSQLPVHRWLRKQIKLGNRLHIKLLENVEDGQDWKERERYWIVRLREEGNDLLNLTLGGEGLSGHSLTPEHRAKIAAKLRTGSDFVCETCGNAFWRKLYAIARGENRFCSRACYAVSNKGRAKTLPPGMTERGVAAAAAKRLAQSRCRQGHELSGDNLHINPRGARICIACRREASRKHRAMKVAR